MKPYHMTMAKTAMNLDLLHHLEEAQVKIIARHMCSLWVNFLVHVSKSYLFFLMRLCQKALGYNFPSIDLVSIHVYKLIATSKPTLHEERGRERKVNSEL